MELLDSVLQEVAEGKRKKNKQRPRSLNIGTASVDQLEALCKVMIIPQENTKNYHSANNHAGRPREATEAEKDSLLGAITSRRWKTRRIGPHYGIALPIKSLEEM